MLSLINIEDWDGDIYRSYAHSTRGMVETITEDRLIWIMSAPEIVERLRRYPESRRALRKSFAEAARAVSEITNPKPRIGKKRRPRATSNPLQHAFAFDLINEEPERKTR